MPKNWKCVPTNWILPWSLPGISNTIYPMFPPSLVSFRLGSDFIGFFNQSKSKLNTRLSSPGTKGFVTLSVNVRDTLGEHFTPMLM